MDVDSLDMSTLHSWPIADNSIASFKYSESVAHLSREPRACVWRERIYVRDWLKYRRGNKVLLPSAQLLPRVTVSKILTLFASMNPSGAPLLSHFGPRAQRL